MNTTTSPGKVLRWNPLRLGKHSARSSSMDDATELTEDPANELASKSTMHDAFPDDVKDDYPHGLRLIFTMASVGISVILGGLDGTIVSTAIPSIVDDFHALGSIGWFGSVYFLTGASNIVWGKVYRYYPIKLDFLSAIALFELGSLICAVSPNATALIIGRAIAGVGAAGLQAGGNIIIGFAASPKRRPIFLGMLGACYTISSALGPIIGGALTSKTTWRWCFWINLPIGGLAFAAVVLGYRTPQKSRSSVPTSEKLRHLNPLTYLLWCAALVCYLLALQYGGQTMAWSSATVVGLLVGFVLLLCAGVVWDRWCGDNALLQKRLVKVHAIAAAAPFVFFLTGNYSIMIYFIPLYFQSVTGASAIKSGIRTLALVLPLSVFALVAGGLIKKIGYYKPLLILGSGTTALAAGLIYTWDVKTSLGKWIGYQILLGAGMGLSGQGSIIAAQVAVHHSDIATATATVLFFQTISGAFFISAANNVFANQLKINIATLAPGIDSSRLFGEGGAANLGQLFSGSDLDKVLAAYLRALRSAYALALASGALAFVSSFAAEWKKVNMDAIGKNGEDMKAVDANVISGEGRGDKTGQPGPT